MIMKKEILELLASRELWLVIAFASILMFVTLPGWLVYMKAKAKREKRLNDSYKLSFELFNGDNYPFHPLSFSAHEHLLTALKGRVKRIALMKDSDVIRECTPEDYLLLKDEVKRLAKLF